MAKKKEVTVEDKLRALYDLQLIDSRIDEIKNTRGELPLEVKDLEDEIEGLRTRSNNFSTDIENLETSIVNKKNNIEESKSLSKKYNEQLKNVRNDREFNSISKEIEFQDLEIQLAEKHINEFQVKIAQKNEIFDVAKEKIKDKEVHLKHKLSELNSILEETEKEETLLLKKSVDFGKLIDERLFQAYKKIRSSVRNGLAVVTIERGASGGSFFTIPPQRQVEIAARKKIITDEHSGRILIDSQLAEEEKKKMSKFFS